MAELGPSLGSRPRVVLVDVRLERRAVMQRFLDLVIGEGTVVAQSASASEALAAVHTDLANAAVVEIQLPLAEGLALISSLRAAYPRLLIVVCTFLDGASARRQAHDAGSDCYLVKPLTARDLRAALNSGRPVPLAGTATN